MCAIGAPCLCLVQNLAGTFVDKAAVLVDLNERALAMRTGVLHGAGEGAC